MSDGGEAPIAFGHNVAVTHASVGLVMDRGDTIWVLICTDRPGDSPGGTRRHPEQWLVFPRSGFIVTLMDAMDKLSPGKICPGQELDASNIH